MGGIDEMNGDPGNKENDVPVGGRQSTALMELFEWTEALAFSLVVIIVIFSFFFRIITVEGESMMQTLQSSDRVIVETVGYTPKYGDIVVVNMPNWSDKPFIKRIIATGEQWVDIDYATGRVLIDGEYIDEPYINDFIRGLSYQEVSFPLQVPPGNVFVMGDNRNHSTDSRSALIGCIDGRYVMGRAIVRIFPLGTFGML